MNNSNTGSSAIIPKGTVINGNIDIVGKLDMFGAVNGNITSDSTVNISGNVTGDIKANDIYTKDSFIVGRIDCVEDARVRENTIILGDINAQNLVVDGAIQGKLDIKGGIIVGDKAIVDSDIKAKTIQVNNGAAINGHCSLCYADINLSDFFPEIAKEKEKEKEPKKESKKSKTVKKAEEE
jgi:cytoskeletal protein CcmA (bactofilin family)